MPPRASSTRPGRPSGRRREGAGRDGDRLCMGEGVHGVLGWGTVVLKTYHRGGSAECCTVMAQWDASCKGIPHRTALQIAVENDHLILASVGHVHPGAGLVEVRVTHSFTCRTRACGHYHSCHRHNPPSRLVLAASTGDESFSVTCPRQASVAL